MDPAFPLSRLTLSARSVADDLTFVALRDVSNVRAEIPGLEHRLIGAHMVSLHAYRWGLGAELYRETRDVDLGIPLDVARSPALVEGLHALGYRRAGGNRLVRAVADIPVEVESGGADPVREAAIDILIPAYTSRARENVRVAEHLTTTEVGGLAEAFRRQAVEVSLALERLNGELVEVEAVLPDEVSVVILRAFVWRARGADTDAVDLWRSLEIAVKAGLRSRDFSTEPARTAVEVIRSAFLRGESSPVRAIVNARGLAHDEAARVRTRLAALADRVAGPS